MKKQSALVAALMLGAAIPSFAQDGFRVGVQLGSMKTTGESTSLGSVITNSGPNTSVALSNYGQPTQSPFALDLAYVKGDDEWSFNFFSSKKSDSSSISSPTGQIDYSLLFGGGIYGVNGRQEMKAQIVDLSWKHAFVKGERASLAVSAGLRYSKVSDEFTSDLLNNTGAITTSHHAKGEGKGLGFGLGLHTRYNFNDRFWMTGGYTATLVNNKVTSDDYSFTSGGNVTSFTGGDTNRSVVQSDAYLRFNVNFVSSFNGYLGYESKDFGGNSAKLSNLYTGLGLPTTHGFGLAGLTLGLSYTF